MHTCGCSATQRCPEAHRLRDQYQAARVVEARVALSLQYSQHLYTAGLMAYPSTGAPTWHCAEACEQDAPCRTP